MTVLAVDTSVAVPLLVRNHPDHRTVRDRLASGELILTSHSLAETFSVITRLPSGLRVGPAEAELLLSRDWGPPVVPSSGTTAALAAALGSARVAGGAVYDALVALAARDNGLPLATRDARALPTYAAVGVEVVLVS